MRSVEDQIWYKGRIYYRHVEPLVNRHEETRIAYEFLAVNAQRKRNKYTPLGLIQRATEDRIQKLFHPKPEPRKHDWILVDHQRAEIQPGITLEQLMLVANLSVEKRVDLELDDCRIQCDGSSFFVESHSPGILVYVSFHESDLLKRAFAA